MSQGANGKPAPARGDKSASTPSASSNAGAGAAKAPVIVRDSDIDPNLGKFNTSASVGNNTSLMPGYGFSDPMLGGSAMGGSMMMGGGGYPGGSMYSMPGMGGSLYGGPMQQQAMAGSGSMYGMGSMYGRMPSGMPNGTGSAYYSGFMGMPGGMGSMYGANSQMGSMYNQGMPMGGSMFGGSQMGPSFRGSIYGGSFFAPAGTFFSEGGSLYGSQGLESMLGSAGALGSTYGLGSVYSQGAHTRLGTVRKMSLPGFSYTFLSDYGLQKPLSRNGSTTSTPMDYSGGVGKTGESAEGKKMVPPKESRRMVAEEVPTAAKADKTDEKTDKPKAKKEGEENAEKEKTAVNKATKGRAIRSSAAVVAPAPPPDEAPNSPADATDLRRTVSGRHLVLSTDHAIHTLAVVEHTSVAMPKVKPTKLGQSGTVTVNVKRSKREHSFNEVVEYNPAADKGWISSTQLQDMVHHLLAGHNSALLVVDVNNSAGNSAIAVVHSAAELLFEQLNDLQKANDANKHFVTFSMCALQNPGEAKDLLDDKASYQAIEMGGSPLFGPVVMNADSKNVKSLEDLEKLLSTGRKNATSSDKLICGTLVLKLVKAQPSSLETDVFLSSLLIAFSKDDVRPFTEIASGTSTTPFADLFRYAIAGPGVTVAAVCAVDSDSNCDEAMADMQALGKIKNTAPRSGNVRRFVDFTAIQYEKLQKKAAAAPSSQRKEMERNVERLGQILNDTRELLSNPATAQPKVYRAPKPSKAQAEEPEAEKQEEEHPQPRQKARATPAASTQARQRESEGHPEKSTAPAGAATAPSAAGQPAAPAGQGTQSAPPAQQPPTGAAAPAPTAEGASEAKATSAPTAQDTKAASRVAAQEAAPATAPPARASTPAAAVPSSAPATSPAKAGRTAIPQAAAATARAIASTPASAPGTGRAGALAKPVVARAMNMEPSAAEAAAPAPAKAAAPVVAAPAPAPAPAPAEAATAVAPSHAHSTGENITRTVVIVDGAESEAYKVQLANNIVKTTNTVFEVTETLARHTVQQQLLGSKATTSAVNTFVSGANSTIISLDSGRVAANVFDSPAWSAVREAVAGALSHKAKVSTLRASMTLLRETGEAVDLGVGGEWAPMVIASSPLFGPVIHNATMFLIANAEDLDKAMLTARSNVGGKWASNTLLYCSFVHCFREGEDVLVSSLTASFAGTNHELYSSILERRSPLRDAYRYAFGGTAATIIVASLHSEDLPDAVTAAMQCVRTCGKTKNRPLRRGSVGDFVRYTKISLEKRLARVKAATDPREIEQQNRVIKPMVQMLKDHEALLRQPEVNFPQAYAPESESSAPAAAATATSASNQRESGGAKEGAPATASPAHKGGSTPPTTATEQVGFTELRVVAFLKDADAPSTEVPTVKVADQDYLVSEVVSRGQPSSNVMDIQRSFAAVHNTAIISARSSQETPLAAEPVFANLRTLLEAVFPPGPGETVLLDISLSVVATNEMVFDALSGQTPGAAMSKPLEISSSPLYGPKVHGITMKQAANSREALSTWDGALKNAQQFMDECWQSNYMILATVIQRRRTSEGDVLLASLTATLTDSTAAAYHELMEKSGTRWMLLACAFGGPCSTVCALSYEAAALPTSGDMTSVLTQLSKQYKNLVSRSGSISAFIQYTGSALALERQRDQANAGSKHHERKVQRLTDMLADHKGLMENFRGDIPAYLNPSDSKRTPQSAPVRSAAAPAETPKEGAAQPSHVTPGTSQPTADRHSSGDGPKVNTVVIVSAQRSPSTQPAAAGRQVSVATPDDKRVVVAWSVGGESDRTFDEVISRPTSTSLVRSTHIDELVRMVDGGFNSALLCCDAPHSNSSVGLAARTVQMVHEQLVKRKGTEVYFSISAIRGDNARNMLKEGSEYGVLEVATSPLFGPCVRGSLMTPFSNVSAFDKSFRVAASEAAQEGAMCVACIAVKQIDADRNDVIINGLLITIDTPDAGHYRRALNTSNKHERGVFQYALGGSCFTVATLGLPEKADEEGLSAVLDVYDKLHQIKCAGLRNGSLRRFFEYSKDAVRRLETAVDKAKEEHKAMYRGRLETLKAMRDDAETMLRSPAGIMPPVYLSQSDRKEL